MKRIEFIAPVEAMRGNLSRGKQTLLYAENNNPAWDAPVDKRSYARNYQPVFVGAKRSSDGHKYFSVKTKTATLITAAAKLNMALLAASSEMANVIKRDMQLLTGLQALFVANHPNGWSFKRWLMYYVREGLKTKRHISFPAYQSLASIIVVNPYITATAPSTAVDVSMYFPLDLIYKFALQLGDADLAKFPLTFNDVTYEIFNFVGKTWEENRSVASGVLHNKPLETLFLNGVPVEGGFIIPADGGAVKLFLADLKQYPVYSIEEGEEVAVETTTEVQADETYVAHL